MTQSASAFGPLSLRRASDRVADVIRRTIFEGEFSPGERLPPERSLADRFQVTRNTIREALRQLEQLRLVSIRQGSGVEVQDFRDTAGLDFLAKLLSSEHLGEHLRHDVLEVRAVVGQAISCHAVDTFKLHNLEAFRDAVDAFQAEARRDHPNTARLQELDFDVHARLIRGAGNLGFVLMYNSLRYLCERICKFLEPLLEEPKRLAILYGRAVSGLESGDRASAKKAIEAVFASQWPERPAPQSDNLDLP